MPNNLAFFFSNVDSAKLFAIELVPQTKVVAPRLKYVGIVLKLTEPSIKNSIKWLEKQVEEMS